MSEERPGDSGKVRTGATRPSLPVCGDDRARSLSLRQASTGSPVLCVRAARGEGPVAPGRSRRAERAGPVALGRSGPPVVRFVAKCSDCVRILRRPEDRSARPRMPRLWTRGLCAWTEMLRLWTRGEHPWTRGEHLWTRARHLWTRALCAWTKMRHLWTRGEHLWTREPHLWTKILHF